MLAGPAAFSCVMGTSAGHSYVDLIGVVVPILIVQIMMTGSRGLFPILTPG
ncbi:MAG TPA: hypothetical protein VMV87_19970 [Burkholderiales bacterium]|nr:hypothetical protein [Burkholderiales bacterium]